MLKDLDERQTAQQGAVNSHIPILQQSSSHKNLIQIVLILVLLNIIGFLGWQLYGVDNSPNNEKSVSHALTPETLKSADEFTPENLAESTRVQAAIDVSTSAKSNTKPHTNDLIKDISADLSKSQRSIKTNEVTQHQVASSENEHSHPHETAKQSQNLDENSRVSKHKNVVQNEEVIDKPKSSMSVSRKKLSSKALIAQKIKRADSAIEKNQITKAEGLLEEVLLLDPKQTASRKKLAALWFGRESFQNAVNLINQGISLAPNDTELRLMKARIYLSQERTSQAYSSLKSYTGTENIEYLSLLATLAQQLNELPMAIKAYGRLTKAQPDVGKWWLGLGVALDSNSEFKKAVDAYHKAIAQDDMSRGSMAFAKKRISELGE